MNVEQVQKYKFPLHHISYCADDKTEKKLFTFIAKDGATGKHHCFVLGSERNAEEITLTIGQAFDLAYKRFLDKQGTQMEKEKQFMLLQQQVRLLTLISSFIACQLQISLRSSIAAATYFTMRFLSFRTIRHYGTS